MSDDLVKQPQSITLRQLGAKIGSRVRFVEDPEDQWRTVTTEAELDFPHLLPWIVEKPSYSDRIKALEAERDALTRDLASLKAEQTATVDEAERLRGDLAKAVEALQIALEDLDEWCACADSLTKAGFNMDDTADRAELCRATLASIKETDREV